MEKGKRPQLKVNTSEDKAADKKDPHSPLMNRESSLLPGEVRTPSFMLSMSTADWAAPGSTIWEESTGAASNHQTPLTGYGQKDVWATETPPGSDTDEKADLDAQTAANVLESVSPTSPFTTNAMARHQYQQQSDSSGGGPFSTHIVQTQAPVAVAPSAFTVQEGGDRGSSSTHTRHGTAGLPTLQDETVAHQIIASAGLPLALHSLLEYIKGGQPMRQGHVQGSTMQPRNFPNLSEPGAEDLYNQQGGRGGNRGGRGGRGGTRGGYANPNNMGGGGMYGDSYNDNSNNYNMPSYGNMMMGNNNSNHNMHNSNQFPVPSYGGGNRGGQDGSGFNVRGGWSAPPNDANGGGGGGFTVTSDKPKSESEILSDLLHFHANFFPPPPPPRVPPSERRRRAELWYHYASKWDITHRLPPPPRSPLPEMEMEYRAGLQEKTRVPYHGDGWLEMSERWFAVMQDLFDYPDENMPLPCNALFVLDQVVTS